MISSILIGSRAVCISHISTTGDIFFIQTGVPDVVKIKIFEARVFEISYLFNLHLSKKLITMIEKETELYYFDEI